MDFAGAHIAYVVASYAVTMAALLLLATFILARDRKLKRELARLEAETAHDR